MQLAKLCVSVSVLLCVGFGIVQSVDFKAPREGVDQCAGCGGSVVALFETISSELCSIRKTLCCCAAQQANCPTRTYIHQTDIPYVITEPGIYIVCENIDNTNGVQPAILIQSDNVIIDLVGNTIVSEFTYAIQATGVNRLSIQNGGLSTGSTSSLMISNATYVSVSDIAVMQSPDNAFLLNNVIEAVIDNCSFTGSLNVASGFPSYTFLIQGVSGAITVSNTQVLMAGRNAFGVLGVNAGYPIIFENCSAYNGQDLYTGDGFYVESSNRLLVFKNCFATDFPDYGFFVNGCSNVMFDSCIAERCNDGGFFALDSSLVAFDNCVVQAYSFGILLVGVDNASVLNCNLHGRGFLGFFYDGIRVADSRNVYLYNNNASNFDGAQFFIQDSNGVTCESCIGNAVDVLPVYSVPRIFACSNATLVLKNCVGTQAGYGVYGTAPTPNSVVIKDSLFAQNFRGIDTQLTPFIILDTRSGTPLNTVADSVGGSVVITY